MLAPSVEQPHLFEAMITAVGLLGGTTKIWRFDRMSTVYNVSSGDVNTVFAGFAKHYGVQLALCSPRSGHRKEVVEKNTHTAAQRWWRTLPDETTFELDRHPWQHLPPLRTYANDGLSRPRAPLPRWPPVKFWLLCRHHIRRPSPRVVPPQGKHWSPGGETDISFHRNSPPRK